VIGELAERENATVFVDEVMQDLVHGGMRMASAGAIETLRSRSIIFTSAAKSFNLGGMRCAVGHFGSASLHSRYCKLPWHLRNGASQFGIIATLAAWQHCATWLVALKTRLEENLTHLTSALAGMPTIGWHPPEAGYLAWMDFSASVAALDPASYFRSRVGLILQPGHVFGSSYASFARLNFGTSVGRLDRVLKRLRSGMLI
jgi:cystathionine beta-lyase